MDFDSWAEWYDVLYSVAPVAEVAMYVELARQFGGPVLEIGVGTGRVAIPTTQAGIDVVGADISEAMLAKAAAKHGSGEAGLGHLELIRADMRNLDLGPGRRFPLITLPSRTLLLAGDAGSQRQTLERGAAYLAPGGRLVFNIFNPNPELLAENSDEPFLWAKTVHPETGSRCLLWAENHFDSETQTNRGVQIVEVLDDHGEVAERVSFDVTIRYLFASEAHEMLEAAGLQVEAMYGDFDLSAFDEDSPEMIFVARRPS